MSTNPNSGQNADPADTYGGYAGYRPSKPSDDPYGAYVPPRSTQQGQGGSSTSGAQQADSTYTYGQQRQAGQQYSYGSTQQQQQQQQQTYQPPLSAARGRSYSSSDKSSTGLEARKAALFSYLGGCFTGLVFFLIERKNRLVRFSAAQSIVLFTPLLVVFLALQLLLKIVGAIWLIGGPLAFLLGLIFNFFLFLILIPVGILWLFLMFQAYRGVEVKLPVVGNYAEALMQRFSSRKRTV